MTTNNNEKVYLLPHTIEYYQKELTRMLEFERYGEAVEMLRFLLSCEGGEEQSRSEWQGLLDWIVTIFPEAREGMPEPEDVTEEDLFRTHMREKAAQEPGYAEKLLDVFRDPSQWEKQVLALEQVRYLDHPDVNDVLLHWVQTQPLPPALQFRALQIMKLRGGYGSIRLRRMKHTYVVQIEDVPTSFDEYPVPYQEVLLRVLKSGGASDVLLSEFAEQTWSEYVAYVFGTPAYLELLTEPMEAWDAWAAAFHYMLVKTSQGAADAGEIRELYSITGDLEASWRNARQHFEEFAAAAFPSLT